MFVVVFVSCRHCRDLFCRLSFCHVLIKSGGVERSPRFLGFYIRCLRRSSTSSRLSLTVYRFLVFPSLPRRLLETFTFRGPP